MTVAQTWTLGRLLSGNIELLVRKSLQQAEIMETLTKGSDGEDDK